MSARPPSMLAAALSYAARGWRVLPVEPCGKVPITAHGCKDATVDAGTIRGWWRATPNANVAIATGAESDIVVLDVDTKDDKRGDRTLVDLIAAHGPIGDTLHAITGSGGDHYFFTHPGGRIGNSAGKLGAGLDTRGDGGFVVAAPSIHACGERYAWCEGGSLQMLPAWLLALLLPPVRPAAPARPVRDRPRIELAGRASAYLSRMPASVSGQGGHQAAYAAAVALVCGFGLTPVDALDLLEHEFNPRCDPPWSRRELEHKIDSADRANRVGRGYLLDGRAA